MTDQLSPQEELGDVIEDLVDLIDSGSFNGGQGNSLITKLQNAIDSLDAGVLEGAAGQLAAFINQVVAFVQNGQLTAAEGQALIDSVNAILGQLEL